MGLKYNHDLDTWVSDEGGWIDTREYRYEMSKVRQRGDDLAVGLIFGIGVSGVMTCLMMYLGNLLS